MTGAITCGIEKAFVQYLKPKGIGCLASGLNNDRESVSQ
jgi:hypothetical protein